MGPVRTFINRAGLALAIMAVGYAAFSQYIKSSGTEGISTAGAATSELDRSTIVGQSTENQFQSFRNSGGLENNDNWRGYQASRVQVMHHENGVLAMLRVELTKSWPGRKLASIDNLRQSLSDQCGSSWTLANSTTNLHVAEHNGRKCTIAELGSSRVEVSIR